MVAAVISAATLAAVRICVGSLGLGLATMAPGAAGFIFGPLGWLFSLFGINGQPFFGQHPLVASLLAGPIWAVHFEVFGSVFHRLDWLSWLQERFLATYNSDVLAEVAPAKPLDPFWGSGAEPALAWVRPSGARLAAWSALGRFAKRGATDGRMHWHGRPVVDGDYRDFAFRWTVLVGASGIGKSRMALEFARHLAKSELKESSKWRDRGRWLRESSEEYVRRVWPWATRHPAHPWDAGWIRPTQSFASTSVGSETALNIAGSHLKGLDAWRPRRPTLLLLDDPRPGDAEAVIGALERNHSAFRFPVRLLIVDQALPLNLNIKLDSYAASGDLAPTGELKGVSTIVGFDGRVVFLEPGSRLDERDVRFLAANLGLTGWPWDPPQTPETAAVLARFVHALHGNPLLIELGLRQVQGDARIGSIDEDLLLEEQVGRITRIVLAMALGGAETERHHRALAAATLCGPLSGEATTGVVFVNGKHPILDICGDLDPGVWRRLFNLSHDLPDDVIPPVRPETIGDAFVRHVLAHDCPLAGDVEGLIAAAWRTNAAGILRTVSRLGGRTDKLGSALALGPPSDVAIDGVRLAMAYAANAILVSRDAWTARGGDAAPALASFVERVGQLTASEVRQVSGELARIVESSSRLTVVRAWEGLVCISAATDRALQVGEASDLVQVLAAANIFLAGLRCAREERTPSFTMSEVVLQCASVVAHAIEKHVDAGSFEPMDLERWADDAADELRNWVFLGIKHREEVCLLLDAFARRPLTGHEGFELSRTMAAVNLSREQGIQGDVTGCQRSVDGVNAIIDSTFAGREAFEGQRAMVFVNLSAAHSAHSDVAGCEQSLSRIDAIIDPRFSGNAALEESRACALANLSKAQSDHGDEAGCQQSLARVDRIVDPSLTGNEFLERWRAVVVANVCKAQSDHCDVAGCQRSVAKLDAIIDPVFTGRESFEVDRARAVVNLSYAQSSHSDVLGCQQSTAKLDAIIDPDLTGSEPLEEQRVMVVVNLSKAQSDHSDVVGCLQSVAKIDRIIDPAFSGKEEFEAKRVMAITNLSAAQSEHADALGCQQSVARLDAIIDPEFAGKEAFEGPRSKSVVNLSWAQSKHSDTFGCQQSAAKLDAIILPAYAGREAFEELRTKAVANLSYAQSSHGDAPGCQRSVARLKAIIDPEFTGKEAFERLRARAVVNLSWAQSRHSDVLGCQQSVANLDAIIDPKFTGIEMFEELRAKVIVNLSKAQSDHCDAPGCLESAARLDAIIDPVFTGDEAFEKWRTTALDYLNKAKTGVLPH